MSGSVAFIVLAIAALLEAGGDAVVRTGLHSKSAMAMRVGIIVLGGLVLTAYGIVVNAPPWDFGRLLGVYVTLFFVAAQIINLVFFHVQPGLPVLVGGAFVIFGGLLMTVWH